LRTGSKKKTQNWEWRVSLRRRGKKGLEGGKPLLSIKEKILEIKGDMKKNRRRC